MMSEFENQQYLITLLRSALSGKTPPEKPKAASFEDVYDAACLHEVANLAFLAVRKLRFKPEEKLYKKWQNAYLLAVRRDAEQESLALSLRELFSKNKIKHLEVQGSVVKKYYPSSDLRMMSDTDIIVEKEKLGLCKELLLKEGFALLEESDEELTLTDEVNVLEIHTDFFPSGRTFQNGVRCSSVLSRPFEKAKSTDGISYYPDDTLLYLFNALHCYKHFLADGAGIRRIMDIFVLKNALKKRRLEYIGILLDGFRLGETDDKLTNLARVWFSGEEWSEQVKELSCEVFKAGNHGSREFLTNKRIKESKRSGKKPSRLKYAFSRFFIDKQTCYAIYPFCKKHRYPLFLCWIHRFNTFVFHPIKSFKALKELSYVKKAKKG